jgi:hypothetical protein
MGGTLPSQHGRTIYFVDEETKKLKINKKNSENRDVPQSTPLFIFTTYYGIQEFRAGRF